MRNLKKFLALVLAMVMAMSLMVTANAATKSSKFPDENIDPQLVEAVDVLAGLEVFKGQNTTGAADAKATFAPKEEITRKEVAALIYRVFSTDVKDTKIHLYKDYANFSDVNSESWYAGYVGLCANHNIIKGSNNGRFYPDNKVTGYEVLAMILRVVGYDEEGEFTGSGWQTRVASKAALLHITDNLNTTNYAGTLNQPATREVVAELIFQTMVRVPQVTHNSLGYNDKTNLTSSTYNPTLGQEKFGLAVTGWRNDGWGNPFYTWTKGGVMAGYSDNYYYLRTNEEGRRDLNYPVYGTTPATVATITPEATKYYNTANVRECDVAHDLGIEVEQNFTLYVNSKAPVTDKYKIVATDTVTRVGGQGRETKVYYNVYSPFAGLLTPTVTMVDTFLAKVTRVTPVVLDHNNHIVQMARADLEVFDRADAVGTANRTNTMPATAGGTTAADNLNFINEDGTRCTNMTNGKYSSTHYVESKTNYTYAVGDYVLVRGYTDPTQGGDNGAINPAAPGANTGLYHVGTQEAIEKMAFETNMLKSDHAASNIAIVQQTNPVLAKQSAITWNDGTHVVGSETKNDQLALFMDYAGRTLNTTFAWYYDQFGNIIGIGPVPNTVNYGVITKLYSAFKQGSSATTGDAVAMAHVKYADGTEADVTISKFFTAGAIGGRGALTAGSYGSAMTNAANSVELNPLYDYNTVDGKVMTAEDVATYTANVNAHDGGNLYVAPVANINKAQEVGQQTPYFGIIGYNMFKFITTEDGVVTAVEVAGNAPADAHQDNGNSVFYAGHHHFQNDADLNGKLSKAQGNITTSTFKATSTVWLDQNVKIILNTDGTLRTFNGLSALPSDVTIKSNSEIDWVDVNGDLRADYVYLYGETTGTVTYGLFYYNGGAASWNGTEGTLAGWLNGEQTTLKFSDEAEFRTIQNSQAYDAHLFAVRVMDGVVEDVMVTNDNSQYNATEIPQLLYNGVYAAGTTTTSTTLDNFDTDILHTNNAVNAVAFKTGVPGSNPYSDTTAAAYHEDTGATVIYTRNGDQFYGTVTADGVTYYVTNTSKIFGIGMGVTHGEAVLEYLERSTHNDVTIVYDTVSNGIIEIYVATDPNVTPSQPAGPNTGLNIVAMRIDNTTNPSNLVINVTCASTETAVTGGSAIVTLRNATTNSMILNGLGVADTGLAVVTVGTAGAYTITVPLAGGSLSNTAGQQYEGRLSLTLNGVTYTCDFSGWSIL